MPVVGQTLLVRKQKELQHSTSSKPTDVEGPNKTVQKSTCSLDVPACALLSISDGELLLMGMRLAADLAVAIRALAKRPEQTFFLAHPPTPSATPAAATCSAETQAEHKRMGKGASERTSRWPNVCTHCPVATCRLPSFAGARGPVLPGHNEIDQIYGCKQEKPL